MLASAGRSIKVHFFSWENFKPIYMPTYARLELTKDGIKMVDYYDYGFKEEIAKYKVIEKRAMSVYRIKRIINPDKLYWVERCGRRKALMVITEKFIE